MPKTKVCGPFCLVHQKWMTREGLFANEVKLFSKKAEANYLSNAFGIDLLTKDTRSHFACQCVKG